MLNSSEPLKKVALIETGRVPFGVSVLFCVFFVWMWGFLGFVSVFILSSPSQHVYIFPRLCICVNSWKYSVRVSAVLISYRRQKTLPELSECTRIDWVSSVRSFCWTVHAVVKSIFSFKHIFEAHYELWMQDDLCPPLQKPPSVSISLFSF